jgi:hypothetical protein
MIQMTINKAFREAFQKLVDTYHYVEGHSVAQLTSTLEPIMSQILLDKYGLKVDEFVVETITVSDSPERKGMKDAVVLDKSKRMGILRTAMQTSLLREAEAQGKLKELETLGNNWLKLKIADMAEVALSNPAIANIGTTALGGFLGTHSDVFSNLVQSLVNGIDGEMNSVNTKSQNVKSDVSADMFAPVKPSGDAHSQIPTVVSEPNVVAQQFTPSEPNLKEKAIKKLTELYIKGTISEEFYNQQIAEIEK